MRKMNKYSSFMLLLIVACSTETGNNPQQNEDSTPDATIGEETVCELPESITIAEADGGSIRTDLGYGIVVNENSSLSRDWVIIHDSSLPIDFDGTTGVTTVLNSGTGFSSGYNYSVEATMRATDSVTAFNARFLTFDVFGERVRTLGVTEIIDIPSGGSHSFDWRWRVVRESDVSEHFASVGFVAQVRTTDGRVHNANSEAIVCVAVLFALAATLADLDVGVGIPAP